jgi:hypothetical protein
MVDALLVFSPLQGSFFFVCALPVLIFTGVTPLLRRRLSRFTETRFYLRLRFGLLLASAGWLHSTLPRLASSFARLVPPPFQAATTLRRQALRSRLS